MIEVTIWTCGEQEKKAKLSQSASHVSTAAEAGEREQAGGERREAGRACGKE